MLSSVICEVVICCFGSCCLLSYNYLVSSELLLPVNCAALLIEKERTFTEEDNDMARLVDGLILLYNMSAHKQLGKVGTFLYVKW